MLKQKRQIFEIFFMVADICAVSLAWVLAYVTRFYVDIIPADKGVPPFQSYLSMVLFVWIIWAFVFRWMGLYKPMRGVRRLREVWMLLNANAMGVLVLIAVTYLFIEKSEPFSRLVFAYFWVFATVLTLIQRSLLRFLLREMRRRGYNLRYLLIVGAGKVTGDLVSRLRNHRELGIQLVGCLSRDGIEKKGPGGIPVVGSYDDLKKTLRERDIDQVLIALPLEDGIYLPEIMGIVSDSTVDVRIVPDVYQFVSLGGTIEEFEGVPVLGLQDSPLDGMHLLAKRLFDATFALVLILALSPLFILLAILVKLSSRGPILYKQQRISVDGTPFSIMKFRTMPLDAEEGGPQWATKGDSRPTPIGRFLRTYSLDELPQLFNVLKGEMSIVGPRPERPVFIEEFRKRIPRYMLRHKVPAGMTGWAQIHGWRGDTSIDKRIEYDLYYIEHWSLFLDIKIVILTLFRGIKDTNAA
jgi:Undecaprenyl-phosphate glucose phosphotransferase